MRSICCTTWATSAQRRTSGRISSSVFVWHDARLSCSSQVWALGTARTYRWFSIPRAAVFHPFLDTHGDSPRVVADVTRPPSPPRLLMLLICLAGQLKGWSTGQGELRFPIPGLPLSVHVCGGTSTPLVSWVPPCYRDVARRGACLTSKTDFPSRLRCQLRAKAKRGPWAWAFWQSGFPNACSHLVLGAVLYVHPLLVTAMTSVIQWPQGTC